MNLKAKNWVVKANPISSVREKHFWFVKVLIELKNLRKNMSDFMLSDAHWRKWELLGLIAGTRMA